MYIEQADDSFDTELGGLLLARIEGYVGPKISVGAQALLAYPTLSVGGAGDFDLTLANFAPTLAAHFGSDSFLVSPGIALGYQTISTDDLDKVEGFSPGAFLELSFPLSPTLRGCGEVGFISQPSGGNGDTEVTFGPIFYLAAGIALGG